MSEHFWEGAVWVYHADIVNDGSNSGNHIYSIVPGGGNEMEILYGQLVNGDTSARVATIMIDDGANQITRFLALTLGAGGVHGFPISNVVTAAGAGSGPYVRLIVAGSMRLRANVDAIAVSENTGLAIACRIRGGIPTVTLTSPTDAVETVNMNQVF